MITIHLQSLCGRTTPLLVTYRGKYPEFFLQKSGSKMTCQVDSNRRRSAVGKGFVVPCVYVFRGKQKHLDRLISVLAKLEVPS